MGREKGKARTREEVEGMTVIKWHPATKFVFYNRHTFYNSMYYVNMKC